MGDNDPEPSKGMAAETRTLGRNQIEIPNWIHRSAAGIGIKQVQRIRSLQHNLHRLNAKVIIIQNTRAEGGVDFHSSPTCIEAERGRAVD
jgi:hypothetical protein